MEEKKLEVKYVFDHDYNPDYATGAYGGVCPNGDIVMSFYQERAALPKSTIVEFGDNGEVSSIRNNPDPLPVIRYIVSGVTMNLKAAKQLSAWLDGMIKQAESGAVKGAE